MVYVYFFNHPKTRSRSLLEELIKVLAEKHMGEKISVEMVYEYDDRGKSILVFWDFEDGAPKGYDEFKDALTRALQAGGYDYIINP